MIPSTERATQLGRKNILRFCGPGGNPELETELGSLSPYVQRKLMLLAGYC
jgi:hypothetical protein